jgi:membrane-associated protease RseP (regulator of RpoE activity)
MMPDTLASQFLILLPHAARLALLAFGAAWVALLVHELGHAIGASATGVRLWGIRLGTGPVVYEGSIGTLQCRIAWLPFGGTVLLLDEDAHEIGYRDVYQRCWRFTWVPGAWRAPLISAAGPLTSLVVAAVFAAAYAILAPTGHPGAILRWSVLANLGGWLNLLPVGPSDGLHVLRHLAAFRTPA